MPLSTLRLNNPNVQSYLTPGVVNSCLIIRGFIDTKQYKKEYDITKQEANLIKQYSLEVIL